MCDITLKPIHLHSRGQQGGGQPLRKSLTLMYCIFITCLILSHGPRNRPLLITLANSRVLMWVVEALLTAL